MSKTEIVFGACSKHPNFPLINCPVCKLEINPLANSIEQFIRMKINAAHRNLDKAQKTNKRLYFSAKLKAFHEVLHYLLNSDKSVQVSDTLRFDSRI